MITTRIALITGGNRGLGRNAALRLGRDGVGVILTYRRNGQEAQAVVREIESRGGRAVALPLDITQTATFSAFASRVREVLRSTWGRNDFDILLNNAGTGFQAPFADTTEAQFDDMVNIHLKGVFFLTQRLLPLIANAGRILNVSSSVTRFARTETSAYAMAKGGLEVLTRYLAKELGPRGIAVNVLAPGATATDFAGGLVRDNAQAGQSVAVQTAMGRVGEPDDIGAAVTALLQEENVWMTGQRIEVSGGMML